MSLEVEGLYGSEGFSRCKVVQRTSLFRETGPCLAALAFTTFHDLQELGLSPEC